MLVDHELSGLIVGLTLATRAEDIYRALIEATAFGTRMIIEAFEAAGRAGATSSSSPAGCSRTRWSCRSTPTSRGAPLHLIDSEQGPALGSAMHAAVAAGAYPDIHAAAAAMGKVRRDAYVPDEARADAYDALYAHYSRLHDHFGRGGDDVMHALRRIGRARRRSVADALADAARARSARCTPSCRATGSSRGRAATSPRACRARS